MTLRMVSGNLLNTERQSLTNTVNCVGVMGKGIALDFKKRYPEMFQDYVRRCDSGLVHPGQPYPYALADGRVIINFPTKQHWRSGSQLVWVEEGLKDLVSRLDEWGVVDLALPPLGCGHGGLAWQEVEPLIREAFAGLALHVDVFVPRGVEPDPPDEEQLLLPL